MILFSISHHLLFNVQIGSILRQPPLLLLPLFDCSIRVRGAIDKSYWVDVVFPADFGDGYRLGILSDYSTVSFDVVEASVVRIR